MRSINYIFNKSPERFIFFSGVLLSFLIPFSFYLSFNRTIQYKETSISTNENIISGIDECSYKNGKLKVSGWATDKEGYGSILVSADLGVKSVYLRTSIKDRQDVSQYFKKPGLYDRSGFSSSLNIGKGFDKIIISINLSRNGKNYVVKYECK